MYPIHVLYTVICVHIKIILNDFIRYAVLYIWKILFSWNVYAHKNKPYTTVWLVYLLDFSESLSLSIIHRVSFLRQVICVPYSQDYFARYMVNLVIGKMFFTSMLLENVTIKSWNRLLFKNISSYLNLIEFKNISSEQV